LLPIIHEALIKIACYIVSEYSSSLVQQGKEPYKIYDAIIKHYHLVSPQT